MTPGADCAERWPLISALLDGETTPVETTVATAHLARCAACRDRVRRCAEQLPGVQGLPGAQWLPGVQGLPGAQGLPGVPGLPGAQGLPVVRGAAVASDGRGTGYHPDLADAVLARLGRAAAGAHAVAGCVPGGTLVWVVGTAACGCPRGCGCGCQRGGACACRVAAA